LINGNFLTMDANDSVVSAVTIAAVIAEVGRQERSGCAQTIDLKGATVIPASSIPTFTSFAAG
jgi:predicted amidohydrolase YtcJ